MSCFSWNIFKLSVVSYPVVKGLVCIIIHLKLKFRLNVSIPFNEGMLKIAVNKK